MHFLEASTVRTSTWQVHVDAHLRQSALEAALHIAMCLRDPARTAEIAKQAGNQSTSPTKKYWLSPSISYGDAGTALLFGQLDRCFPGQDWDKVAHDHLVRAASYLEMSPEAGLSAGIFGGLAGLCFTTQFLSHGDTRYQRLQKTLDDLLLRRAETIAASYPDPRGTAFDDYDLINGPAGIGAYLLVREQTPLAVGAVHTIVDRMIALSEMRGGLLGFFVPPELQPTERHRERFPQGSTDCGLAHGVPGPLAFLSLAHLNGVERPGLLDAIERLTGWIANQQRHDAWGVNWPYAVSPDDSGPAERALSRAAWCYGSPGIARALWLAGAALRDVDPQYLALRAIRDIRSRPANARGIDSPILCHGIAGLLEIVLRFANEADESFLTEMACELTQQLLERFEPDSLAGFRDLDPDGRPVDSPGVLEGAAGIALTLLAAATEIAPAWDRLFLLA